MLLAALFVAAIRRSLNTSGLESPFPTLLADLCTADQCSVAGSNFADDQEVGETITDVTFTSENPVVFQKSLTITTSETGTTFRLKNFQGSIEVKGTLTVTGQASFYGGQVIKGNTLILKPGAVLKAPMLDFTTITMECDDTADTCPTIIATDDVPAAEASLDVKLGSTENYTIGSTHNLFQGPTGCPNWTPTPWDGKTYGAIRITCNEQDGTFVQQMTFLGCLMPTHIDASGQCAKCPEGQESVVDGSKECISCGTGSVYNPTTQKCDICRRGTYSNGTACNPCAKGTYQNLDESTECLECPYGSSTVAPGSDSVYDCICKEGFYGQVGGPCSDCPLFSRCPYNSTWPEVEDGSWMDSDKLQLPVQCSPLLSCEDGRCTTGYTGTRCGSCSEGYYRSLLMCVKCSKGDTPAFILVALVLIIFLCLVATHERLRKFAPHVWIVILVLQELSFFGMLDVGVTLQIAYFQARTSVFLLNPQLLALPCHGWLTWVVSMQAALAMPFFVAVVVAIFSAFYVPVKVRSEKWQKVEETASRFLPRGKKVPWTRRLSEFGRAFVRVFRDAWKFVFIVFFPGWINFLVRAFVWLLSEGGKQTEKIFDLEPATSYSDPVLRPFWVAAGIEFVFVMGFGIAILVVDCLERYRRYHMYYGDFDDEYEEGFSLHEGIKHTHRIHAFWPILLSLESLGATLIWNTSHSIATVQVSVLSLVYVFLLTAQYWWSPYVHEYLNSIRTFELLLLLLYSYIAIFGTATKSFSNTILDPAGFLAYIVLVVFLVGLIVWNYLEKRGKPEEAEVSRADGSPNNSAEEVTVEKLQELARAWMSHARDKKYSEFYDSMAKAYGSLNKYSLECDRTTIESATRKFVAELTDALIDSMDTDTMSETDSTLKMARLWLKLAENEKKHDADRGMLVQ